MLLSVIVAMYRSVLCILAEFIQKIINSHLEVKVLAIQLRVKTIIKMDCTNKNLQIALHCGNVRHQNHY